MRADSPGVLVIGATGVLGRAMSAELLARGARVMVAGRDPDAAAALAGELQASGHVVADLLDVEATAAAVAQAAAHLDGLDGLVIASGVAAFGPAVDEDDAVVEELFAINTLGPMAAVRAAVPVLRDGGAVAVLSAVLVDVPTAQMAAYSASKAALSTWLQVLRRELRRRKISVLDARPPHMETGLAERALAGTAPTMPAGHDVEEVVSLVVDGMYEQKRELVADLTHGTVALA